MYIVLYERNNNTTSFAEHLKFLEKMTYTNSLWVKSGKTKLKKTTIRTPYIFKLLNIIGSVLM